MDVRMEISEWVAKLKALVEGLDELETEDYVDMIEIVSDLAEAVHKEAPIGIVLALAGICGDTVQSFASKTGKTGKDWETFYVELDGILARAYSMENEEDDQKAMEAPHNQVKEDTQPAAGESGLIKQEPRNEMEDGSGSGEAGLIKEEPGIEVDNGNASGGSRPTSSDRKLDSDEEEDKSGMELKNIPVEAAVPTLTASDLEDSVKEENELDSGDEEEGPSSSKKMKLMSPGNE